MRVTKAMATAALMLAAGTAAHGAQGSQWVRVFSQDFGGNAVADPEKPQTTTLSADEIGSAIRFSGNAATSGVYYLTKQSTENSDWHRGSDHTYPYDVTRGYYMRINPNDSQSNVVMYVHPLSGICQGATFKFSAFMSNLSETGSKPHLGIGIYVDKEGTTLVSSNAFTDITLNKITDMTSTVLPWQELSLVFQMNNSSGTAYFIVCAIQPETNGFDFALDDITIDVLHPTVNITNVDEFVFGQTVRLAADFENDGYFSVMNNVIYNWYYSADGSDYQEIYASSYSNSKDFVLPIQYFDKDKDNGYYRVKIGEAGSFESDICSIQGDFRVNETKNKKLVYLRYGDYNAEYNISADDPNIYDGMEIDINSSLTIKIIIIQPTVFPLWVGGVQVCETNQNDILGNGTARFEGTAAGGTLALSNAVITNAVEYTSDYTAAIYAGGGFDLTISLDGSNRVQNTSDGGEGIHAKGNLSVGGEGSLTAEGGVDGSAIYADGNLRMENTTVTASGVDGLCSGGNIVLANAIVTATGSDCGIFAHGAIAFAGESRVEATATNSNGMAVYTAGGITMEDGLAVVLPVGGGVSRNGKTITDSDENPAGHALVAYFYDITVTGGSSTNQVAAAGFDIDITANAPQDGQAFVRWTSDNGLDFANAYAAETTFTMLATNVTVTANFADIVIADISDQEYTGSAIQPQLDVSCDGQDLVFGTDYDVSYANNTNAGTATATVTMRSPRTGSASKTFEIARAQGLTVSLGGASFTYDGQPHALSGPATNNAAGGATTVEYSRDGASWTNELSSLTATTVADSCAILVRATNPNYANPATNSAALTITKAANAWIAAPTMAGWTAGSTPATPNRGRAKFGTATVTYGKAGGAAGGLGATRPSAAGNYVATFTVPGTANYGGLVRNVPFTIKPKPAPKSYTVKFKANGGKLPKGKKMSAQTFTPGKAKKLRKNAFKRKGYVFVGWAKRKNGPVAYRNGQKVKNLGKAGKTVTLYAVWANAQYKVVFDASGGRGKMPVQVFTYGKPQKLVGNRFTRKGYVFGGWAIRDPLATVPKIAYRNGQAVANLSRDGRTVKLYAVWKRR